MLILDEIIEQFGGIEYLRQKGSLRFETDGATLFLKSLEFGPAGGRALHLDYKTENENLEMHFEKHSLCWLPYYHRDSKTETEVFLYEFVAEREPLRVDMEAGSILLQRALFLELILRAHRFDCLDENLYHPLFARSAS